MEMMIDHFDGYTYSLLRVDSALINTSMASSSAVPMLILQRPTITTHADVVSMLVQCSRCAGRRAYHARIQRPFASRSDIS